MDLRAQEKQTVLRGCKPYVTHELHQGSDMGSDSHRNGQYPSCVAHGRNRWGMEELTWISKKSASRSTGGGDHRTRHAGRRDVGVDGNSAAHEGGCVRDPYVAAAGSPSRWGLYRRLCRCCWTPRRRRLPLNIDVSRRGLFLHDEIGRIGQSREGGKQREEEAAAALGLFWAG